ncbi:M3 family metallopeptidase [Puniceicoccaceae bacterium K14]|nr:M3 family metallopeptidase [Puniceicoccaceae bacterium K14]
MPDTYAFLDESKLIDWSSLTTDLIESEISHALEVANAEIEEICGITSEEATFENTFLALENAGKSLGLGWGRIDHLTSVCDSKELRDSYNAMLPKVTEFHSRIPLNSKLWKALKAFAEKPEAKKLEGVEKRYFDETIADFQQAGADLEADSKSRLEAINKELAQKTQKYSENVLDSTNAYELLIDDESKLAGLPESAKAAALQNAKLKEKGTDEAPVWRFTLNGPSVMPVLKYLDDESIRKELWTASSNIAKTGEHDNTQLIRDTLKLRQEKAELLGQKNFADQVLQRRMAKSGSAAWDFSEDIQSKASAAFKTEIEDLRSYVSEKTGKNIETFNPWSLSYWSEKLRVEKYDFDEEELRPYFAIDKVLSGMFRIAENLFGLRIQNHDGPERGWHKEVKVYDLFDESGELLGYFYADWHPREEKRSGAWMNYLYTGGPLAGGGRDAHVGLICGNMTAPVGDKPALLTHNEVETVFHEFGHLLHHLLGKVDIKSLNGVNVAWDFVELPSQIMENWCWNRDSLDQFARHHETGERIPDALFDKMVAARNFESAMMTMRQISFGKMDLAMHIEPEKYIEGDLHETLRETIKECLIPTSVPSGVIVNRFTHLFSSPVGYAAGYYSYKWAEVLDADAFTRFEKEGVSNPETGRAFRECVLSKGNSEDPMDLFVSFMGRKPNPIALLKRSGLA